MDVSGRDLVVGRVVWYPFGGRLVYSRLVFHLREFFVEQIHYFSQCCDILPADVSMLSQRRASYLLVEL